MIPLLIAFAVVMAVFTVIYTLAIIITYGSVKWHPSPRLLRQLKDGSLNPYGDNIISFRGGSYAAVQMGFADHDDLDVWYPILSPGYRAIVARRKELLKEREL